LRDYAARLAADAERYGVELGDPHYDDDGWSAKLDVVLDERPELASFTFSLPSADDCRRARDAGITTVAMVTTVEEAQRAVAIGIEVLVVQGPSAGGHRGVHDTTARPPTQPLPELLSAVLPVVDVPVIAAGGLATVEDVDGVLRSGAVAAQLGTAFLLADEAGTNPVHRAALQSPEFTETVVMRCFTGRYARGLGNRFTDRHDADAPPGFPDVHYLTAPVRRAAVAAGDPQGTHLWAGTEYRKSAAASAADIMAGLACR
jgi:nitronate monooxygenase